MNRYALKSAGFWIVLLVVTNAAGAERITRVINRRRGARGKGNTGGPGHPITARVFRAKKPHPATPSTRTKWSQLIRVIRWARGYGLPI